MNEESFIRSLAQIFPAGRDVFTPIGDDAAALDLGLPYLLLAAADQVLENVHFLTGTDPALIAGKLLKRNISDIAAMGGTPTHALLTLALENMDDEPWLMAFHRALSEVAARYGISVIGGDVAKSPAGKTASLTILGKVEKEKLALRCNAKPGDRLYLTGTFGRSFPTEHHLTFLPRLEEARFLAGTYSCAMMDVSDGLAKDLARFAAASGVAAVLDGVIPGRDGASEEEKLFDGEDYELIVAVPEEKAALLEQNWKITNTPLTCAGYFTGQYESGTVIRNNKPIQEKGYDHFENRIF